MKRVKIGELRELVDAALEKQRATVEALKDESNPQIIETVTRCKGEINALEAVQLALEGEPAFLRILAG